MQQKLFQNFFTTRSWSFWKYHRKGTAKTTPKIEKNMYIIYLQRIFVSGSFLQKCINFVEQRLKFCHFEGITIP